MALLDPARSRRGASRARSEPPDPARSLREHPHASVVDRRKLDRHNASARGPAVLGNHPTSQLPLFEGSHIPHTAAREALSRGELGEARAYLARLSHAPAEAADAARLERIDSALREARERPIATVHAAFASALGTEEPRGFLSDDEWFRAYAQHLARAFDAEPVGCFRGWLGAHFSFAAGDAGAAWQASLRIVELAPPGTAWIEAARLAFELGEGESAQAWIHGACLGSLVDLSVEPPAFERCGVPRLDAAAALPRLPPPIEDLFDAARALEDLPGPRSQWVAVVGEIDRVLAPRSPSDAEPPESPSGGDAAREFLAALRAARRSRERDGPRGGSRCSDRELRSRRRMQRLAPALFERYLRALGASLL